MEQHYAFPFTIDQADPLEPRKPERRIGCECIRIDGVFRREDDERLHHKIFQKVGSAGHRHRRWPDNRQAGSWNPIFSSASTHAS